MDYSFKFKFEINLQSFATTAIAVNLWEQVDIKKKVNHLFKNADYSKHEFHNSKENKNWNKIVDQVSQNASLLNLTEELMIKVKTLAEPIGDHIYHWNFFLLHNLRLPLKFTKKLYWTPYGTIDEDKIFQMCWEKMDDFADASEQHVVLLSTLFVQEDLIRKNILPMAKKTVSYLAPVKIINNKCNSYTIIVIWLCIYFSGDKENAIELYKRLRASNTTAKELFMMCLEEGLFNATKYFWNKLTEDEKKNMRVSGFKKCIDKWINRNSYEEEKCLKVIYFLINNMPDKERFKFMLADDNIERIFQYTINIWPYQNMIEPMIDVFLNHLKYEQVEYFFLFCLNHVTDGFLGKRFINKDVCRAVLPKVFPKITLRMKLRTFPKDDFLETLFKLFDIPVLRLYFNDEDLSEYKEKMFKVGDSKFKELIRSGMFELLDKFTKDVFVCKSDQKKFKLRVNIAQDLINEGKFDLADKLMNWISDSNEEKILMKKSINALKVCSSCKNFKTEMLDEFLLWQCDSDEERKNVKESMKNNEFICEKIILIWNENDRTYWGQCLKFLTWLGGSPEKAIELKNNIKVNEKFVEKFCDTLPSLKMFKRLGDLFRLLSVTPENILEIKQAIMKDLPKWIFRYIAIMRNFRLAEAIIDYVSANENQKKRALGKIFSTVSGTNLIFEIIRACSKEYISGILFVLNEWVKPYGDARKLREKVGSVKVETFFELSANQILVNVLDVLKEGDEVSANDILSHEIRGIDNLNW